MLQYHDIVREKLFTRSLDIGYSQSSFKKNNLEMQGPYGMSHLNFFSQTPKNAPNRNTLVLPPI